MSRYKVKRAEGRWEVGGEGSEGQREAEAVAGGRMTVSGMTVSRTFLASSSLCRMAWR